MENQILKQIIIQIKKYELTECFSSTQQFEKWISELNETQINNFLSLDVKLEEIKHLKHLLINSNLLNCKDYKKRLDALKEIKNVNGCVHLTDYLCAPNFLKSKNFYKDIKKLSKAPTARYGLWIIAKDSFINSPYHDEDFDLLINAHDNNKGKALDFVMSDVLATVASNIDSIKSPYHQADMKLISESSSEFLQSSHTYPENSLNNLAVNKVSLSDKYHLENMKILATNKMSGEFLYKIMTNPKKVNGKYYREEINAISNAKSRLTARALYYYIANPKDKFSQDRGFFEDYNSDEIKTDICYWTDYVSSENDPEYINNLAKINKIDDYYVMHYVSLLMDPVFLNSPYKKFDLKLLDTRTDKKIYMDLYKIMIDETFANSKYHENDATIISKTSNERIRYLLIRKACNMDSINSKDHEYDMNFISKLNLESISEKLYNEICYYLFADGMRVMNRREKLEKLSKGIFVERETTIINYLDSLQEKIENSKDTDLEIIKSNQDSKKTSKIIKLFKKNKKK